MTRNKKLLKELFDLGNHIKHIALVLDGRRKTTRSNRGSIIGRSMNTFYAPKADKRARRAKA
jgi:hypothetical protein